MLFLFPPFFFLPFTFSVHIYHLLIILYHNTATII